MRKVIRLFWVGLAVGVVGCTEDLTVENNNSPEAERALSRPGDVENLIAASYSTMWNNSYGTGHWAQIICFGMENYSNLANFGMGSRSQLPRPPVDNSRNANGTGDNAGAFNGQHRAARAAALGLSRVLLPTFTFFPTSVTQNNRAIAFANLVIGVSLGQVAIMYDSGAAVNENDDPDPTAAPIPLLGYSALMAYAISRIDTAALYATAARFGTQTIPGAWVSSATNLTVAQFSALIRGYRARLRAGVARNPTERAAVDWVSVLADANAFLAVYPASATLAPATEFVMTRTSTSPFGFGSLSTLYQSNSVNWHQVWGFIAGMAADQAAYDAWLATAPDLRTNYVVVSADRRFPAGATRAAQQAVPGLYFENKATGNDWFGDPTGNSQYRHVRWLPVRNGVATGATVTFLPMPTAEMNLLAAEAEFRAGLFAAAAARVNLTRVGQGVLPAAPGDNTSLVPGGANCVPRIPVAPFNVSACGNLWEALKWEKRLQTQFTIYGAWYTDSRGWGDLPQGTAEHWPVPYQEKDTRAQPFYVLPGTSGPGTYGI